MTERNHIFPYNECEEFFYLSLQEITDSFGVTKDVIVEIINEGIIDVASNNEAEWQFNNEAVGRIRTVLQLQRDLNINLAGSALVLELLAEIDNLHHLLK